MLAGTDPKRRKVQSSMYRDLRCNLPRQCMAYLDFPFAPEAMLGRSKDDRVFCSHAEVCAGQCLAPGRRAVVVHE